VIKLDVNYSQLTPYEC